MARYFEFLSQFYGFHLTHPRSWRAISNECNIMAENLSVQTEFKEIRQSKRKKFSDELTIAEESSKSSPEETFKCNVYNVLLDSIIGNMTKRFNAVKAINSLFNFFMAIPRFKGGRNSRKAKKKKNYEHGISQNICDEVIHLQSIYSSNLQEISLSPIKLLNKLKHLKLEPLFQNIALP
jgi:hypothetical protein